MAGTAIIIDGTFSNPNLPQFKNYRALLTEHANCIGIWKFDDADALTITDDKVATFANWKTGGASFSQSNAARRGTVSASSILGRNVLVCQDDSSNPAYYDLSTSWDNGVAHTKFFIGRHTGSTAQTAAVIGGRSAVSADDSRLGFLAGSGTTMSTYHKMGTTTVQATTEARPHAAFHTVIGSFDGDTDITLYADGTTTAGTRTSGAIANTISRVGDNSVWFPGELDCVGFFEGDVLNDPALEDLKTDLLEWLAIRAAGV